MQAQNFVYYILSQTIINARLKEKYTVMFVEDIHLLDTASMQVLIKLAKNVNLLCLLLLLDHPIITLIILITIYSKPLIIQLHQVSRVGSRVQSRVHSRRNSLLILVTI